MNENDFDATKAIGTVNPWEVTGAPPESARILREEFDLLQQAESPPPGDDDIYKILIGRENTAAEKMITFLRQAGLPEEKIAARKFTRKELRDAGFAFVNRIGDGEKPLIAGEFPDPDDPGKLLDYTDLPLLTPEQLDKVYRYQQANPEKFGLQGHKVEDVKKDMLLFLQAATHEAAFTSETELGRECMPFEPDNRSWMVGTAEEREKVQKYLTWKAREIGKYQAETQAWVSSDKILLTAARQSILDSGDQNLYFISGDEVVEDHFAPAAGMVRRVRSHQVASRAIRYQKLQGTNSPFLDSGFVFGGNPDLLVELNTDGEAQLRRLNIAVVHLMGHPQYPGLSEMGGTDHDQVYMSPGEYVKHLYPPQQDREYIWRRELTTISPGLREQTIEGFQRKIIEYVRAIDVPEDIEPLDLAPVPRVIPHAFQPPLPPWEQQRNASPSEAPPWSSLPPDVGTTYPGSYPTPEAKSDRDW